MARTPVRRVGAGSGQNRGEWSDGRGSLPDSARLSRSSGTVPSRNMNVGTFPSAEEAEVLGRHLGRDLGHVRLAELILEGRDDLLDETGVVDQGGTPPPTSTIGAGASWAFASADGPAADAGEDQVADLGPERSGSSA